MKIQTDPSIVLLDSCSPEDLQRKVCDEIIRNFTNIDIKYFELTQKNLELTDKKVVNEALETIVKYDIGIIIGSQLDSSIYQEIDQHFTQIKKKRTQPLFKDWSSLLHYISTINTDESLLALSKSLENCLTEQDLDTLFRKLS